MQIQVFKVNTIRLQNIKHQFSEKFNQQIDTFRDDAQFMGQTFLHSEKLLLYLRTIPTSVESAELMEFIKKNEIEIIYL